MNNTEAKLYYPTLIPGTTIWVTACRLCGAVVADQSQHREFHAAALATPTTDA